MSSHLPWVNPGYIEKTVSWPEGTSLSAETTSLRECERRAHAYLKYKEQHKRSKSKPSSSVCCTYSTVDMLPPPTIFFAAITGAQLQCYELEKKMEFKGFSVF